MDTNLTFNMNDRVTLQGLLTQRFFHAALDRGLNEVSTFDIRSESTLEAMDKLFGEEDVAVRYTYLPADPRELGLFAGYMYDLGDTLIFAGFNKALVNGRWDSRARGVARRRRFQRDRKTVRHRHQNRGERYDYRHLPAVQVRVRGGRYWCTHRWHSDLHAWLRRRSVFQLQLRSLRA